ncbi:HEAT repeat domain-containing protein [Aporhodopirellula aestuarii]|uniref:HEAT repeat domain-containing protein n=1 Tax=Aporhodopirellula aestuarii TaxID=2950107 RepID=A0ABT0U6J9_9BACT|nr:HEAT repeat domain-containing protein [Aporhodopirellula aestuarii]MCM2372541.1 HEAT repeat domain-containing protein [Aporhodopirellula aestuarii]
MIRHPLPSGDRSRPNSVSDVSLASSFSLGSNIVTKRASHAIACFLLCLTPVGIGIPLSVSTPAFAEESGAGASVPGLIQALGSDEVNTRWKAARDLGRMGPAAEEAIPRLLAALKDPDSAVRLHAATAIGHMGNDSQAVVAKLIEVVGDSDTNVRIAAVNSIRQLVDDPEVLVPLAVGIIEKEDPLFASRLVETIVMRGEKAVPYLIAALKNDHAAYWSCLAIEELGPTASATVPALIDLFERNPDSELKVQALLAFAKIGPEAIAAKPLILSLLTQSTENSVITAAAYASGSLGIEEATTRLRETVDSDEPLLALVSRWALAKLHPDDESLLNAAVDELVTSMGSDDASLRLAAAKGLQSLPVDPGVVGPKLMELLNDSDPVVAYNLVDALASLGEAAATRAGKGLANEEVRDLAVKVLDRLGEDASPAVPDIVSALAGAEGEFRSELISILAQIGPPASPATTELINALDDASDQTRVQALYAIGSIGPGAREASPAVKALLVKTDDTFERILAAWAISQIDASNEQAVAMIVPVLIEGLSFPDGRVQAEAASTLGSLGPAASEALDELDALSANEFVPPEIREVAKDAADAIR